MVDYHLTEKHNRKPPADVSELLAERPKDQPWRKRFIEEPEPYVDEVPDDNDMSEDEATISSEGIESSGL